MKELKDELRSLEDKVEALIEHLTRKDLSSLALESLSKKLNELELQKVNIQEILKVKQDLAMELSKEPDVEQIRKRIEKFANGVRDLDRSAKRALLEQIFEKIEVTKDNTLIVFYRAKHVKVSDNRGISENGLFNGKNGVFDFVGLLELTRFTLVAFSPVRSLALAIRASLSLSRALSLLALSATPT